MKSNIIFCYEMTLSTLHVHTSICIINSEILIIIKAPKQEKGCPLGRSLKGIESPRVFRRNKKKEQKKDYKNIIN